MAAAMDDDDDDDWREFDLLFFPTFQDGPWYWVGCMHFHAFSRLCQILYLNAYETLGKYFFVPDQFSI